MLHTRVSPAMSNAMVTNDLCILKLIAIFHGRIRSDDPENFLRGGGATCRSTTVLPLQNLCQDESDKVLPLQNPYPWKARGSGPPAHPPLDPCKALIDKERESIFLYTF